MYLKIANIYKLFPNLQNVPKYYENDKMYPTLEILTKCA